ncbi:MAG: folate family ECF transporter S component [Clostridiales bacterium]|nr:folate family ECF transporter S component [Clostridiales bacterium]
MSLFIVIIGALLFGAGAFSLYSGLMEKAGLAVKVREALSSFIASPKTALVIAGAVLCVLGFCIAVWGSVRSRREKSGRAAVSIRVLTALAMLLAMTIMLDRFPGLSIKTPGWKIGFSFIPPMLAAILYGPVEAAIVYGLADLIGAVLFPFGPYHPGFTVIAALMGFILGVFLNKRPFAFAGGRAEWKKISFFPNCVLPVVINCLVLGLLVNTLWVSQLYGSKTYWGWFVYRLLEYAILVPVQLVMLPVILKLGERIRRTTTLTADRARSAERLRGMARSESILGLERIKELLSRMGDPQDTVRIVHVAGTNGKGSFTAMLSSILKEAGYNCGSFTSPAVLGVTDSFRINGERISDEELDEIIASIEPEAGKMAERPTEFEVLTAAAYELFKRRGCDIAVVECGLGGAGDSTNVIASPVISVITNVELDHTDRLGKTTAEIAKHKAGVIKKGRPVLWGGSDPAADAVISARASEMGSKLVRTDHSRLACGPVTLDGTDIEFEGAGRLHLSLIGAYQPKNAANVLTAVEMLRDEGVSIPAEAVSRGLAKASWPARFEILRRDPFVIFDGSHNPDGIALAAESIKSLFPGKKAVLLMGVMADKDHKKYPALLADVTEKVFAVTPANPRSLPARELAEEFVSGGVPAEAGEDLAVTVGAALKYAKERDLPLIVLGTLYMYKEFTEALGNEN